MQIMQGSTVARGAVRTRLVVFALLLIALITGLVLFSQYRERVAKSPKTAANTFVSALITKDSAASYDMLTDRSKKEIAKDEWKAWVDFTFKDYAAGDPEFVAENPVQDPSNLYGKNATPTRLTYQFTFEGKSHDTDIVMAKSGETWKISEVNIIP
jgi:hypothetical protein